MSERAFEFWKVVRVYLGVSAVGVDLAALDMIAEPQYIDTQAAP